MEDSQLSEVNTGVNPEASIPQVINAARQKMQREDYNDALELVDAVYQEINIVDRIPLDGLKADCFHALGNFEAALECYENILRTEADTPYWVHVGYANVLERSGQNDDAISQMCSGLKKEFSRELLERAVTLSQFATTPAIAHKNIADTALELDKFAHVTETGEFLISKGLTLEGCRVFENVKLSNEDDRVALIKKMAIACIESGESKVANSRVELWLESNPECSELDGVIALCLEARILDSVQGMPCFTVAEGQSLSRLEVRLNGYRIRNCFQRYARLINDNEGKKPETERYLLILPKCYVDSKKDTYLLTIEDKENHNKIYSASYPTRKLVENDRELYLGDFEYIGDNRIHGWYLSEIDNTSKLEIYINDEYVDNIDADLDRTDVAEKYGKEFQQCGFDYLWSKDTQVNKVELRSTVTGLPVLGTPIKIQRIEQAVKNFEKIMAVSGVGENGVLNTASVEGLFQKLREQPAVSIEYNNADHNGSLNSGVSVVVPIYNALDDVRECLESILSTVNKTAYEIVCVNDCSTDKGIEPYLRDLAESNSNITFINSDVNRGFVKSVNKGLLARAYKDVVILNSDTVVPEAFVDRIHTAGQSDKSLGVITPLSNNATIFSFPLTLTENILEELSEFQEIDELLRKNASGDLFEVPTAHGYCMYVKGEVIEKVGILNEDEWGVGYGEENDYCQRVKMHGWRIAAYHGMYVAHTGSVSFGDEKRESQISKNLGRLNEIYPEYDKLIQKHIHEEGESRLARNKLQLLKYKTKSGVDDVLFVTHSLGGGTTEYLNRCVESLSIEGVRSIFLTTEENEIVICTPDKSLCCNYRFDEIPQLRAHLKILQAAELILNSTFNFPTELFDNIQDIVDNYTVVLHDYSWICPKINMIDASGSYCGMPSSDICVRCIEVGGTHESFNHSWKNVSVSLDLWLTKNKALLQNARMIIAPSHDTAKNMKSKYPDINIQVKHHMDNFKLSSSVVRYKADSIDDHVIGIFGMIGDHKGMQELKRLCWILAKRHPGIKMVFFGTLSETHWMKSYKNVSCAGEYSADNLGRLISKFKPTFGLFLSKWPETYCYTITDAVSNGVYPIALDIGAFPERMMLHNYGATIPFTSDVEKIYDSILSVVTSKEFSSASVNSIKSGVSYDLFSKNYFEIAVDSIEGQLKNTA